MQHGWPDGRKSGKHYVVSFVELSNSFATQSDFLLETEFIIQYQLPTTVARTSNHGAKLQYPSKWFITGISWGSSCGTSTANCL